MPDTNDDAAPAQASKQEMVPVIPEPAPVVARSMAAATPSRVVGKTRNPWGCWLLGLTLVYPFIWYFKINKELRDFDPTIDVQPGTSVLAILFGYILVLIPPIVSRFHTSSRIQKAQKLAGSAKRCSAILGYLCFGFRIVYMQSQLNKVWDQYGNPPLGTPIAA